MKYEKENSPMFAALLASNPVVGRLCLVLGCILACVGSYFCGQHTQLKTDTAVIEANKKICEGEKTEMVLAYQIKVDEANERSRLTEHRLTSQLDSIGKKALKEKQDADQNIIYLKSLIASGSLRLYLPTYTAGTWSKLPSAGSPSITSGIAAEGRTELLPATATALVDLAAGCNAVVRQRNDLVDRYEAVRKQINSLQPAAAVDNTSNKEGN